MRVCRIYLLALVTILGVIASSSAQSSTGSISGTVDDNNGAVVSAATISIRNTGTGLSRSTIASAEGHYNFVDVPAGTYEVTAEAATFATLVRNGIILAGAQNAIVDFSLKPGVTQASITVTENASALNTTTSEIGTHFTPNQITQLPTAPDGSAYSTLLQAPGVTQADRQAVTNLPGNFSSNGNRLRSNNFMLDGQDVNDPNITGAQIPLNNPDAISEVQIVTNQFLAEYGRNSGSVSNFVTKSGTNRYHSSGILFYNGGSLNSCSNLDKAAGFCDPTATDGNMWGSPPKKEFRYGFTAGGPIALPWFGEGGIKKSSDTFFFADFLEWTDRQFGSGSTINGAPTIAGRATLQQYFGQLPQVQALLQFVPPGTGNVSTITAGGHVIEVGSLTGWLPATLDETQGSVRIDHVFGARNLLYGRFRWSVSSELGEQATPPGLGTLANVNTYAATVVWNSTLSTSFLNTVQLAWTRFDGRYVGQDQAAASIPSIEITELGMNGPAHNSSRTAFGMAFNFPQTRKPDIYQVMDHVSYLRGEHSIKFGADYNRRNVSSFFVANTRGRLLYNTLQDFLSDRAQIAAITLPLPGGELDAHYGWNEFQAYVQDEWRIKPTFILTLGLRYEYPGNSFGSLEALNQRILAANGNDPAFGLTAEPSPDTNNFMPRVGFAWTPETKSTGPLGWLTGGNKAVIRGGYSRAYDGSYLVMYASTRNAFPFVAFQPVRGPLPSFATLQSIRGGSATILNPAAAMLLPRNSVAPDFRMPLSNQVALDYQRELSRNVVIRVGYVGTFGRDLFQSVDGNPRLPCDYGSGQAGTNTCNTTSVDPFTGTRVPVVLAPTTNPSRGPLRLWANNGSSSYNAFQASFEKRFSGGFTANVHYTWSKFIDTASDIFGATSGDAGISIDSFNLNADRARSAYDYPQRLAGNAVYQLPFGHSEKGLAGQLVRGWQISAVVTLQSGAPFSVLNGSDPAGGLAGIDALVGDVIRPNVYTNLNVSKMSVAELYATNQRLRNQALATAAANFNALPPGACVEGFLPGAPLNNLLFAKATARITCSPSGARSYTVDFNGVEPGQRFGNSSRNMLRSDSLQLVDFSLAKNTQLTERFTLQLRADVFNLFNHGNFGAPDAQLTSANFLNKWATDGGNRRIVLGMRVSF
jgi:hypothetical protein